MAGRAVGVGVAGLGRIGRVHAVNLATRVPGAYLAGVADPSPGALKECNDLFDVPCSQSFEELIDDPRIHAVVIATPACTHPEMVRMAAGRGTHILCEKPLALDIAKGEEALTAAKDARVLLQVGFHRRFDRDFMIAKSRIDEGRVGEVFTFFDSMRDMEPPTPESVQGAGQALLHDAACHDLDAARWMVGEINEIRAFGASLASEELKRMGQIDHALIFLRFENGALGTIDNSPAVGTASTVVARSPAPRPPSGLTARTWRKSSS